MVIMMEGWWTHLYSALNSINSIMKAFSASFSLVHLWDDLPTLLYPYLSLEEKGSSQKSVLRSKTAWPHSHLLAMLSALPDSGASRKSCFLYCLFLFHCLRLHAFSYQISNAQFCPPVYSKALWGIQFLKKYHALDCYTTILQEGSQPSKFCQCLKPSISVTGGMPALSLPVNGILTSRTTGASLSLYFILFSHHSPYPTTGGKVKDNSNQSQKTLILHLLLLLKFVLLCKILCLSHKIK